jgi:hypothetical protein
MSVDMMSVDTERSEVADSEEFLQYRALSSAAVTSLLLGLLSALACLSWIWVCIPLVGVVVSVYAWRTIARRRDELTGGGLAQVGLALAAIFLVAGPSRLIYEAATEVPEGYDPISYAQLQPDPDVPGQEIPPAVLQLENKKVFIKGFVFPTEDTRQFLLVRDQGTCCFGGNPKITDRIQVTLTDPLRLAYKPRLFKVAGKFHVRPAQAIGTSGGVFYHLEADHLE